MFKITSLFIFFMSLILWVQGQEQTWIRINQLGYLPKSTKVAVWVSKTEASIKEFKVVDSQTHKVVFTAKAGKAFGAYGPFAKGYRLNFSKLNKDGSYYIQSGAVKSPIFRVGADVYRGTADFVLRYMRQQRTLFNPYLKDSCHTHDGFTMYAQSVGLADSTHVDAGGGWHDASDYLQYATTSANATYHLLAAYRDFPTVFTDEKAANGLDGANGIADVLDEAKWGLDWLLKMHPQPNIMYNQIADDRDHTKLRMPGQDSIYGRGHERPVYFIDGNPQQRGKFLNNTTGTSSTAAKFVSAFGLGYQLWNKENPEFAALLKERAQTAYNYAHIKPGVTQTVSVKSPYIYAEDNWVDDMQLSEAYMYQLFGGRKHIDAALAYASQEKVTPWMIRDTANHYQYYPFINLGHDELAKHLQGSEKEQVVGYYKQGIEAVMQRASQNMFYRGVPYVWCSNNLTVAFAMQCLWYKKQSGDRTYDELEQANIDWLFGANPWGTSMVYGLPSHGDTPLDPHSAFTFMHQYPIDGGLVDGPVYANTYNNLIGIKLLQEDEYKEFQSDLAVYHDDFGDYSTNEPTMDGTASLLYLLSAKEHESLQVSTAKQNRSQVKDKYGAVVQGDSSLQQVSLVFTGDEFRDGLSTIEEVLQRNKIKNASFFVTGRFLQDKAAAKAIKRLHRKGHTIGPHSDQHLLYHPWSNRDSMLVSKAQFLQDLQANIAKLQTLGIHKLDLFIPPYEWYNKRIVDWSKEAGMQVYNFTPGLRTAADYTYPEMGNRYKSSQAILDQMMEYEAKRGLKGHIILIHMGADMRRKDKFYDRLTDLVRYLTLKKYKFASLREV